MKQYIKVLATSSLVGLHAVSGISGLAIAQSLGTVTITGSSGGCYPNCTPYAGGPSGGGVGSSVPENEAYANAATLFDLARKVVDTYKKPCVVRGEPIVIYSNRAIAGCIKHVAAQLPYMGFASRDQAAQFACEAHRANFSETAANPAPSDICTG